MKFLAKRLVLLAMVVVALAGITDLWSSAQVLVDDDDNNINEGRSSTGNPFLRAGANYPRFLAQKKRKILTCDKYPRVCGVIKGSPAPDCCKKKCVNVKTDHLNCGMCGNKCKYSHICCKGKCVNPMSNINNCGTCTNKCNKLPNKLVQCVYGMCSYA